MKRKLILFVAMLLIASLFLAACSKQEATGSPSAGTVTPGATDAPGDTDDPGSGDGEAENDIPKIVTLHGELGATAYTDELNAGRVQAEEDFDIITEYVEVVETADYETQMRFLAETGEYDLILIGSLTATDVLRSIAADYPDQKFSIVDTRLDDLPNVHSTNAKDPEQAFLSGVISGLITTGRYQDAFPFSNDSNVLGYAGGTDTPTSRAGAAGYMAGAKFVNPDVEILYTIVGNYNDPAKGKEIALTGIAQGADIVTGNCGAGIMGVLEACKEQEAYFIATSPADNDVDYSLCCSVKRADIFVYNEIKSIVDGTWEPGHVSMGIKEGACDASLDGLSLAEKYPQEVLDIVDEIRQMVVDGSLELPYDVSEIDEWSANNQYSYS